MKKYLIFFIFIYLVFTPIVYAVELPTAGFIPGQIWYSKDSLIEGETVKIYTAIWNNSISSLSAKVEFYDKNVILGTRDIIVPTMELKEVYILWKVTSGDHQISAKILSPSITLSGKKEVVMLSQNTTEVSSRFVPLVLKTIEGNPATSSDIVKNQIDKATSSIGEVVPVSISTPISKNVGLVDVFRTETFEKISETKATIEKEIELLKKVDNNKLATSTATGIKKVDQKVSTIQNKVGIEDATQKPIAYLKLFFFSILAFIFGNKIVFYSLIILFTFFILRGIYRKIRNK